MLIISLVSTIVYLAVVPFFSPIVSSVHYTRVSVMVAFICLALGAFLSVESVDIYHSLFNYSSFTIVIDSLLYLIIALVLIGFSPRTLGAPGTSQRVPMKTNQGNHFSGGTSSTARGWYQPKGVSETFANTSLKPEYSLILIFGVLGASIIISASDIISIYVALELQSFGLYLLACLRTEETGSTHASLKYFLLGAISSAFILLGISIVYQEVGSTQFQNISSFLLSSSADRVMTDNNIITLGILSILCGFMFKISAAPFHSWFADVIQGVPTYTSIVIINLPKISIFTFLFHLLLTIQQGYGQGLPGPEIFIVITTISSLILGTVAGLMQTKMKRLLAFSTISHVGFILIGLTANGSEISLNAIIFYLVQYTLTVVLTFLVLIAYETTSQGDLRYQKGGADPVVPANTYSYKLVNYIVSLQGVGQHYKLLTFTFVLCLFSMAGIPPITGFYAKLGVLNGSIIQNISLVFVTAIICSIISAAYYLKIIKVLIFDSDTSAQQINVSENTTNISGGIVEQHASMSPVHSYTISCLTAFLTLFILDPKLILNCTELVALTIYLT